MVYAGRIGGVDRRRRSLQNQSGTVGLRGGGAADHGARGGGSRGRGLRAVVGPAHGFGGERIGRRFGENWRDGSVFIAPRADRHARHCQRCDGVCDRLDLHLQLHVWRRLSLRRALRSASVSLSVGSLILAS